MKIIRHVSKLAAAAVYYRSDIIGIAIRRIVILKLESHVYYRVGLDISTLIEICKQFYIQRKHPYD